MNIRGLLTLGEVAINLKCPRDEVTILIAEGKFESEICAGTVATRIPLKSLEEPIPATVIPEDLPMEPQDDEFRGLFIIIHGIDLKGENREDISQTTISSKMKQRRNWC